MFQDYALFLHLDVQHNVEYGLKVKGVRGRSVAAAPASCSKRSACPGLPTGDPPSSAVGSANAPPSPEPSSTTRKCCFLDEPLGALDLKLREEMQVELKLLQRDVGITSCSSPTTRAKRCR